MLMSAEDDGRAAPRAQNENDWAAPLAYWRGFTAEMFDEAMRSQVRDCVRRIGSTMDDWRGAINGDAAAAVKVASRMRMPAEINSRLDVTMTVLLVAAFDDAGAAKMMASLLQRAPLDPVDRAGLSTSWLVHKIWRESVIRNARKRRRSRGSESAS
jgi:hypothetical protein